MLHNQTGSYHCLLSHIRFPSVPGRQVLLQFLVHGPLQCTDMQTSVHGPLQCPDMQTAVQLPDVISQERYFGYLVNNTGCMFGHSWFQRSLVYMFHRHTVLRIQVWHPVYRHVALQLTHQYPSLQSWPHCPVVWSQSRFWQNPHFLLHASPNNPEINVDSTRCQPILRMS